MIDNGNELGKKGKRKLRKGSEKVPFGSLKTSGSREKRKSCTRFFAARNAFIFLAKSVFESTQFSTLCESHVHILVLDN